MVTTPGLDGAREVRHDRFSDGAFSQVATSVPRELPLAVYVNGRELVTILCTPVKLNCLIVGYMYAEGIISHPREITSMRICVDDSLADVRLNRQDYTPPDRRVLTSGCGGGVSFDAGGKGIPHVESELQVTATTILDLMKQMQDDAVLFHVSRAVHTSALASNNGLLISAEDIGRHNTLDKILGECLLGGIPTAGHLLLTTGRLSSEMVMKAARMGTPVVVSRSAPTDRAIALAQEADITVVGYARGTRLSIYTREDRFRR